MDGISSSSSSSSSSLTDEEDIEGMDVIRGMTLRVFIVVVVAVFISLLVLVAVAGVRRVLLPVKVTSTLVVVAVTFGVEGNILVRSFVPFQE